MEKIEKKIFWGPNLAKKSEEKIFGPQKRDFDREFIRNLRPIPGCTEMIEHFKTMDLAKDL